MPAVAVPAVAVPAVAVPAVAVPAVAVPAVAVPVVEMVGSASPGHVVGTAPGSGTSEVATFVVAGPDSSTGAVGKAPVAVDGAVVGTSVCVAVATATASPVGAELSTTGTERL